MPRIVDHAHRREDIARCVVQVIQTEGLEGATTRRIAAAGGFTIGVLAHYFRDKDQMIGFAFDWIARRSFTEMDAVVARASPGLAQVRAALEYMVPEPDTPSFIAVWLGLWSGAVRKPVLARTHAAYYAQWRRRLRRYLSAADRRGEIAPRDSLGCATDLLIAAVDGLWLSGNFEPRRFSRRRRAELLDQLLAAVLVPRRSGVRHH